MEESSHAPKRQKIMRGSAVFLFVGLIRVEMIKSFEGSAEIFIGFVNRQTYRENIDGMTIVITVFHYQGAGVGFRFGEHLNEIFMIAEASGDKHLKEAIIDCVGIIGVAGIDKGCQFIFQTEAVEIHLHVVGNLIGLQAFSHQNAAGFFDFRDVRVKQQIFAAFMNKPQHSGFQVVSVIVLKRRLLRSIINPIAFVIFFLHRFQRCISHFRSCFLIPLYRILLCRGHYCNVLL